MSVLIAETQNWKDLVHPKFEITWKSTIKYQKQISQCLSHSSSSHCSSSSPTTHRFSFSNLPKIFQQAPEQASVQNHLSQSMYYCNPGHTYTCKHCSLHFQLLGLLLGHDGQCQANLQRVNRQSAAFSLQCVAKTWPMWVSRLSFGSMREGSLAAARCARFWIHTGEKLYAWVWETFRNQNSISFHTINTVAALMDIFRGCAVKYALKFDLIRNILVARVNEFVFLLGDYIDFVNL